MEVEGFRHEDLGFRVDCGGLGFRHEDVGFRVDCGGFRV